PNVREFGLFDVLQQVWKTGEPERHPLSWYQDHRVAGWRDNYVYKLPSGEIVAIYEDMTRRKQAEEARRESEQRFRSIIENTMAGYFLLDKEGIIRDVNPAWVKLYHYDSAEEVIGQHFTVVQKLDDVEQARELVDGIMRGDARYLIGEFSRKCKDGAIGYHTFSARPVSHSGEIVGIEGFIIDTTERIQAEKSFQESEAQFRALFETMTEGVALHEVLYDENGKIADYVIIDVNPAYVTQTGVSRKAAVGLKASEAYGTESPPYLDIYEKVVTTGMPAHFETYFVPLNKYFSISVFSPRKGQFATVFADITERKIAEEERERLLARVQESAQRVRQIMDTVPEGVLLLNSELHLLLCNPIAEEYLHVLTGPHGAKPDRPLTHLGTSTLTEILTSPPQGLWHEVTVDQRIFQVIAREIHTGPMVEGWVLVMRDVTKEYEVQQVVQRQERLAAVGQLAAGIAHDFNNIIAAIVLYSQMSLRTPDISSKLQERLRVISEQGQRASDLINQILDFSRSSILDRRPLELVPLLKEQVKLWQRTLPEHIYIDLTYGAEAYVISADPTRMQQVFMNLAVNARDAMPDGGMLRIDISCSHFESYREVPLPDMETGDWIKITFSDTGMGMSDHVVQHLFEPFFTTKERGQGTGLGLAQVYNIIMHHEGKIDVQTAVGKGTTFILYLPALPVVQLPSAEAINVDLPLGHQETILVVEDNPVTRAAVLESLELLGYRTLEAVNGQEALDIFAKHRDEIALVLSDLVMPEMGGRILTYRLREIAPEMRVVVMSGHPLNQEQAALHEAGVIAWLQKPPDLEQLAEVLARALQKP
ncbi:MAG: PAS domain S-box protein, partial [Anaerolineae bacterium]|nr:PAS domain S-box protein [Anaerolineae bacterium]